MPECRDCKTCRWWNREKWSVPSGWGTCDMTATNQDALPGKHRERPETLAYTVQYDYYGALATAPGFGCVQWQRVEPERDFTA